MLQNLSERKKIGEIVGTRMVESHLLRGSIAHL